MLGGLAAASNQPSSNYNNIALELFNLLQNGTSNSRKLSADHPMDKSSYSHELNNDRSLNNLGHVLLNTLGGAAASLNNDHLKKRVAKAEEKVIESQKKNVL